MQLSEAIDLIKPDYDDPKEITRWADLGCGTGLFTQALASLQQPGSTVYAIDSDCQALTTITDYRGVTVEPLCGDFTQDEWPYYHLNGILMANSLHYVSDKKIFVQMAIQHLTKSGTFLIVEYDTETANRWVPYPISYLSLRQLFEDAGCTSVEKRRERPSIYERATMYSAYIRM